MRLAAVLLAAPKTLVLLEINALPTSRLLAALAAPAGCRKGSVDFGFGLSQARRMAAKILGVQAPALEARTPRTTDLARGLRGDVRAAGAAPGCQHAAGVAQGEEGLCVHGGSAEWGVQCCERHDDVPHVGLIVHSSQRNKADHVPGTRPTVHAPAVPCHGPSRCTGVRRVRARTDSPLEAHAVTAGGRVWCD